jgi:transcriptional regulator with XRE-family HTH domain
MGKIRELRKAAGLSQAQLAEALGLARGAVTDWESGKHRPRLFAAQWATLCRLLNTTAEELNEEGLPPQPAPTLYRGKPID